MGKRQQSPHYISEIARGLRQDQTYAEELLWERLRNRKLIGAKFRRQHPIGRYIADFYCHESRLAVELQGGVHLRPDQMEYDEVRQTVLEQQGVKLRTFTNQEVAEDIEGVLLTITDAFTPDPSPSGRGVNEAKPKSG